MSANTLPRRTISEQLNIDALEAFMATGVAENASQEVKDYLYVLREVSDMVHGGRTATEVVNHLVLSYGITRRKATSIYTEAINYFYMDSGIKPRAIAALYADRIERITWAILTSDPTHDDMFKAANMFKVVAELRGATRVEQESSIPDMMPHTVIYSGNAQDFGFPQLGGKISRVIESLPISEAAKKMAARQAGILKDGQPPIALEKPR